MVPDQSFEIYRQQIALMTQLVAIRRRSASIEDREAQLGAACKCAELSLKRDLEAIVELGKSFDRVSGELHPR